jgi:hypothetical protein
MPRPIAASCCGSVRSRRMAPPAPSCCQPRCRRERGEKSAFPQHAAARVLDDITKHRQFPHVRSVVGETEHLDRLQLNPPTVEDVEPPFAGRRPDLAQPTVTAIITRTPQDHVASCTSPAPARTPDRRRGLIGGDHDRWMLLEWPRLPSGRLRGGARRHMLPEVATCFVHAQSI